MGKGQGADKARGGWDGPACLKGPWRLMRAVALAKVAQRPVEGCQQEDTVRPHPWRCPGRGYTVQGSPGQSGSTL